MMNVTGYYSWNFNRSMGCLSPLLFRFLESWNALQSIVGVAFLLLGGGLPAFRLLCLQRPYSFYRWIGGTTMTAYTILEYEYYSTRSMSIGI